MSKADKILKQVLHATADTNVRFDDLRRMLAGLGFDERVKGGHHIFSKDGVEEILNLQSRGGMAKAYQVKQTRRVILRYKLGRK